MTYVNIVDIPHMGILHKQNTRSKYMFSSIKIIVYIISCGRCRHVRHTINHPLIVINKCVSKMYWGLLPILIFIEITRYAI